MVTLHSRLRKRQDSVLTIHIEILNGFALFSLVCSFGFCQEALYIGYSDTFLFHNDFIVRHA